MFEDLYKGLSVKDKKEFQKLITFGKSEKIEMSKEQFVVIGGQYESYSYGTTATLLAAKRLATANAEHWDNWQGVHVPNIYKIEDTKTIISKGRLTLLKMARFRIYGLRKYKKGLKEDEGLQDRNTSNASSD